MKKLLALILITSVLLTICACSEKVRPVPSPMAYPDYTFDTTPTPEQMRQTAVRATRDLLTIQWTPADTISYYNTAGRDKQFDYIRGTSYGGVLYSGAGSGLFQYLEFYDLETGLLSYPGDSDELRNTIGSGCADSLLWGWSTVCTSIKGGYYPSMMVYKNGYYPVGNYTYNQSVQSYYYLPTKDIIKNNGEEVIMDAYTKVLPADAFISSIRDHAMMVVAEPTVVYLPDGTLDKENSFVLIQDQRGGNTATDFFEVKEKGKTVHYNGRTEFKVSFAALYKDSYIPVTCAEFLGIKEYEAATVTTNNDNCTSIDALQKLTVESNYPIAVINITATKADGAITLVDKILFNGAGTNGTSKKFALSQSKKLGAFDFTEYSSITVEVVTSTGERFAPIQFPV